MGLFDKNNRKGGFMDEIRCDEPSYLIWKWHPSGVQSGQTVRENSIRWGSSLRVKDGEVAVFVYKQKDGTMQDFIEGPFDQIIKTANFRLLRKFCVSEFRQNQEFHVINVHNDGLFPLATTLPIERDGMRAARGVNAVALYRES